MTLILGGSASDDLPDVLATGNGDVRKIFLSMSAREPHGRDAEYLEWHSLDHRPEQYRIAGLRHSIRLVSTPACRAMRLACDPLFDAVDHVMTYFFAEHAAFDQFDSLSRALGGERRPFRLPSVHAGYFDLAGKLASRAAIAGADVIPWRPARGVFLLVEQGMRPPDGLVETPGVAGAWWHTTGSSALQVTYCFLHDDPLATAQRLRRALEKRWDSGLLLPRFAAPLYTLVPFEWDKYLP